MFPARLCPPSEDWLSSFGDLFAPTYNLSRGFCLKHRPRDKYAGSDADGAKENLKYYVRLAPDKHKESGDQGHLVPGNFDNNGPERSPREEIIKNSVPMVTEDTWYQYLIR